jgi:hypothetical protein
MRFVLSTSNTNRFVGPRLLKIDPHLMYKVEKFVKGEHQCESCGFDPVVSYPDLHTKGQSSMLRCRPYQFRY